jgi:hypothetical protein
MDFVLRIAPDRVVSAFEHATGITQHRLKNAAEFPADFAEALTILAERAGCSSIERFTVFLDEKSGLLDIHVQRLIGSPTETFVQNLRTVQDMLSDARG